MEQVTYLLMVAVEGIKDHNKYYKMVPHGTTWTAEYGRVGANPRKMDYPMSVWDKKYREQLNKGYVDRTELHKDVVITITDNGYKDIDDVSVSRIVDKLQEWANATIRKSYKVTSKEVTEAMVIKAQSIIDNLSTIPPYVSYFNDLLVELFTIIPRKMTTVSYYLAYSIDDYEKIVQREQDLLDVMKGQINIKKSSIHTKKPTKDITILQAMGIRMRQCTSEEMDTIREYMDPDTRRFVLNAWRVNNEKTDKQFDDYVKEKHIKNIKFYYHGSRNENFWNIIGSGMNLHPNAAITGKMFGMGLYFAPKAGKSLNYTSLDGAYYSNGSSSSGIMAVFKVAVGKSLDVNYFENKYTTYTEKDMLAGGFNSLYVHKGDGSRYDTLGRRTLLNDEVIVYNENAVTLQYIVELGKKGI